MITSEAASLSISIATGLVKLAGRLDEVQAERVAAEGAAALPMPKFARTPGANRMRHDLKKLLEMTRGLEPDLLIGDREPLTDLVGDDAVMAGDLLPFFRKYFPDQARRPLLDPDAEFINKLREARPDLNLDDYATRLAAFYVTVGKNERDYTWRIALTVVDVVAEFGAANTGILTRNPRVQKVVESVLTRFADSNLDTVDSWGKLLHEALRATLNGVLDQHTDLAGDQEWLQAVLGALANARSADGSGDDFVVGLLRGRGYRSLVKAALEESLTHLQMEDAKAYSQVAADMIKAAIPLVDKKNFSDFFEDHWADLLRAGLRSLHAHGPEMLKGESPILRKVLVTIVGRLSETPDRRFLTTGVLVDLVDTTIGIVASDPTLVTEGIDEDWLKEIIDSAVGIVVKRGVRDTFTREGVEEILHASFVVAANNPELLVKHPGLLQEITGAVLDKMKGLGAFTARELASAAVSGALESVAANPKLLDFKYAEYVSAFSSKVAGLVAAKSLTRIEGRDVLAAGTAVLIENPALFLEAENELVSSVVDAVLIAAKGDPTKVLAGTAMIALTQELLHTCARHGIAMIGNEPIQSLADRLSNVLVAGLTRAQSELGNRLSAGDLPVALAQLVASWARGEVAIVDPADARFKRVFAELATRAAA